MKLPPLSPEARVFLKRTLPRICCTLAVCFAFLTTPQIALRIPSELPAMLSGKQTPPLSPLKASAFAKPEESEPEESEPPVSEEPIASEEASTEPEELLPVFAENYCWYDEPEQAGLFLINRTHYNVKPESLLERYYPVAKPAGEGEPLVLILHTHGTESYLPDGASGYREGEDFRSDIEEETVVHIGEVLAQALEQRGISVLHDKTMQDAADFNTAYDRSRAAARKALQEHPSIRYILDVHRDSIFTQDGTCCKPISLQDGTPTAQLMLVVGTDQDGANHPYWKQNLTVAVRLQDKLNTLYPMLARPINLRTSAFNQALLPGSLLLEVGSCGNTVSEAENAVLLFADAFAELISETS